MDKIFLSIYQFFRKRPKALYGGFILLMVAFIALSLRVHLDEDISRVLPADARTKSSLELFRASSFSDKLIINIRQADTTATPMPDSLVAYGEELTTSLRAHQAASIAKVQFRMDPDLLATTLDLVSDHVPMFLDAEDYDRIDSLLTPEGMAAQMRRNLDNLQKPSGMVLRRVIAKDPSGISNIALAKLRQLQAVDDLEPYDGCLLGRDRRNLLIFLTPAYPSSNTAENGKLLSGLDAIIDTLDHRHPGIRADYAGAAAVSYGNAKQLRRDSILTLSVTVLFLVAFLAITFRRKRAPLLVLIPVIFGGAFALAITGLLQGGISMIAVAAGSIVMGIAVNYSIHVYNHYRHTGDAARVIQELAKPLTIGSLTTIGGFFCLRFAELEMLRDLGLFAGLSLIGAALCSLIFMPHFIVDAREAVSTEDDRPNILDTLAEKAARHGKWIILVVALLTVFFYRHAGDVRFDADMMHMNWMDPKLREAEHRLDRTMDYSSRSVFVMSKGRDLDHALAGNERTVRLLDSLKKAGVVKRWSTATTFLLSDSLQRDRAATWKRYWTEERKQQASRLVREQGVAAGFSIQGLAAFDSLLAREPAPLDTAALGPLRRAYLDDYLTTLSDGISVMTIVKVPNEERDKLQSTLRARSDAAVLDRQELTNAFMGIINQDFGRIALIVSILVFVALVLTYGRIELALVSYVPMLVTWIWILGIMAIFDIPFNIVNIIISALIFGLGDDYSLFVIDGLLQRYVSGKQLLRYYRSSIWLSAVTTIFGLGVLLLAKHPALRSIAWLSVVGIVCVLLISQFLIPVLFRMLIGRRVEKGRLPWTLGTLAISAFAFIYFVIGSLLLTVAGVVTRYLLPLPLAQRRHAFHWCLSKCVKSLVYVMANVRKRIVNPLKEDHAKPAVIICNHQSFLDILVTVMLHPRLILLTNDWVWNSPVFGFIVKMADFYPVSMGAETGIARLKEMTDLGYSIVVFPEGTRSPDGKMKRFHKGAFYIAEQLGLDILPIILHGTGYTMSKSDFMLKNGTMTVRYMPRITPDDKRFGEGYKERAKHVGAWFRSEYDLLRSELEVPRFFRQQLTFNYVYKGPVLEWYQRVKTRLEGYYDVFHPYVPMKGRILDAGCGYGFLAHMLHYSGAEREILGIDHDGEKIAVAQHGVSRKENLQFRQADLMDTDLSGWDAILMLDVIHYIAAAEQEGIIRRAMRGLHPNGVLILRDGDASLEGKHARTRLTEFFSTTVFGFNKKGSGALHYIDRATIERLMHEEGLSMRAVLPSQVTSNTIFVIQKKQDTDGTPV